MAQSSGGPPSLPVGTEVSAKYRGAFCEAQVKTVQRVVKCKVVMKDCQTSIFVTDEEINGQVKLGSVVEVKHPDTGQPVEAVINKLMDNSVYTVVFDDGDERTLRRTQLCLKGDKHFIESETLDNLPLSHPEHFGTPVLQNKKSKRKTDPEESDSAENEEEESPRRTMYRGRHQELVGKLMMVDQPHRKGSSIPALVVLPDANSISEVKNRDQILVRSFRDSKFSVVTRKDLKEFSRGVAIKNDDKTMRTAFEKALLYFDTKELPVGWNREEMLGSDVEDEGSGEEDDEYASEDEPYEEKDRFVAQLYKFMDDRGTPINKGPCIGNKDLNLYKLFKIVQNCGGYNKVTKEMKWHVVYSKMGLPSLHPNPGHQIKTAYKKYLDAYETFYRKLGSTMGTTSRPGRGRQNSSRSIMNFRGRDKSPRSPKPPVEKIKEIPELAKVKEETASSVDEDSASVGSVDSEQATSRRTPRRDQRAAALSDAKDKKEEVASKKKEDSPRVKKEDVGGRGKKDASPVPTRGKKEDTGKAKKEEVVAKKDERKSSRKGKAKVEEEKEGEKEVSKKEIGRPVRKEKEEDKKEVKGEKPPVQKDSPKKRITRRKLLVPVEKKETEDKDKPEVQDKKETAEKRDVTEKKEAPEKATEKKEVLPKKLAREPKHVEKKEIPRTLERRDSRASERKESALRAAEKKEAKTAEKKAKQAAVEEKKVQKKEKKDEEVEVFEKSEEEEESDPEDANSKRDFAIGSKLKVKYGRGKTQKIYLAKVVDTGKDGAHKTFLVHYAGWNTRYDEWIRADRVVAVLEKTESAAEKPKSTATPKPLPSQTITKPSAAQKSAAAIKNRGSIFRTPKLGTAKTRATRSSSSELLTPAKKPGKRMTRRGSALTDSTDSKSTDGHLTSDLEDSASSETLEDKVAPKEEEEVDVEQDEVVESPQDSEKEEELPRPEKEAVKEETAGDAEPKVETQEETAEEEEEQKPEKEEEEEAAEVGESVKAEVEKEKLVSAGSNTSLAEFKPERASVAMAEMMEPISEIKSLTELTQPEQEEKEEEKGEGAKDASNAEMEIASEKPAVDDDTGSEKPDSPKEEPPVIDSESPKEPVKEQASAKCEPSSEKTEAEPLPIAADQSIPQLKKMVSEEEKPGKESSEKGRTLKGRKRDASMERKRLAKTSERNSLSEIPTLEPILSSVVENSTTSVPKSDPSPYDFVEEADTVWQPELTKKWEPIHKVLSSLKDSGPSEEGEEKEKKKVKKKTKKKMQNTQPAESKNDESLMGSSSVDVDISVTDNVPSLTAEAPIEKSSVNDQKTNAVAQKSIGGVEKSSGNVEKTSGLADKTSANVQKSSDNVEKSSGAVQKFGGVGKKKGRKRREAEAEIKKEPTDQDKSVVNVDAAKDSVVDDKPVTKKRRTKRVSESDKKDTPRAVQSVKKLSAKDTDNVPVEAKPVPDPAAALPPVPETSTTTLPGTSSASGSEPSSTGRKKEASICDSQGFEPHLEDQESSVTPFDNTPPTTPEHDDAEGGSSSAAPNSQQTGTAYSSSDLSPSTSKVVEPKATSSSSQLGGSSSKCASESPSDNEVTSTASTDNLESAAAAQQSESSGTDQDLPPTKKRKQPEETSSQVAKKRKRVHGTRSRTARKSPKYCMSDSMSYKTSDSQGSGSTPNHCPDSPANKYTDLSKSPRPSKYNFSADLGEYLEGEERCNFLITKMKEIRSIYMNLKSEVATIDRRRKRARRKERESSQSLRCDRENST